MVWNLEMACMQNLKLQHVNDTRSSVVFQPCEIWGKRLYWTRISRGLSKHVLLAAVKQYIVSLYFY